MVDSEQFQKLLEQVKGLDPEQFKALVQAYEDKSPQGEKKACVYAESEQRLAKLGVNSACPACGSVTVVHNGVSEAGIQRFKCQDCGKNFTRFTGTLLEKSHLPWDVWVAILKMTLADTSLQDMVTILERDYDCEGINLKTVFFLRLKLIYAMAALPLPTLTGVVQVDETFVRESQKGQRELVSYVTGIERVPRYGYHPSKLGTMGAEFATTLTGVDSRGLCVCKVVSLGRASKDHAVDFIEQHCMEPAFICSDGNAIYEEACEMLNIPLYVRPSNYTTVLKNAGYVPIPRRHSLSQEEFAKRWQQNRDIVEKLYRDGTIDYISQRGDLSYGEFRKIKNKHRLSLARANELHKELKFSVEKKMTNVATKYLPAYMAFFAFRHNWRAAYGHTPANQRDAEYILERLLTLGPGMTRRELESVTLDLPKPSGRAAQLLKERTEQARQITKNRYFKFDSEDVPSFNRREILLDAPHSQLVEIAKAHKMKGYTKMTHWVLAAAIMHLPNVDAVIMDLITRDRHYQIDKEDLDYLKSLKYRQKHD